MSSILSRVALSHSSLSPFGGIYLVLIGLVVCRESRVFILVCSAPRYCRLVQGLCCFDWYKDFSLGTFGTLGTFTFSAVNDAFVFKRTVRIESSGAIVELSSR